MGDERSEHDPREAGKGAPASGGVVVVERLRIGELEVELERPADPEALLDERAFERQDEFLPYWAELWPSALALAAALEADPPQGLRVLELGCGLGLPAIVAARLGATVTACDWSADAVRAAQANAARNGAELTTLVASWFAPGPLLAAAPWDLVVAADVFYERRNAAPLLDLVPRLLAPGGRAWIADPGRHTATELTEAAAREPQPWRIITP